jgi:hypothetical protein
MAQHDPTVDQTNYSLWNGYGNYERDHVDDKDEHQPQWTNPFQKRPSRAKNKTPVRVRAAKRHRKNKAAKLHRKAIKIALATKRNREG